MHHPCMKKDAEFQCQRCGACCRVPGYVALQPDEPEKIAAFLGLDTLEFTERYTQLTFNRSTLSLTESADGACVFLEPDNTCRIQAVKPGQCLGFPSQWTSSQIEACCPALKAYRG